MTRPDREVAASRDRFTGQRFGNLTALYRVCGAINGRQTLWKCRCDCGTETIVYAGHLPSGHKGSNDGVTYFTLVDPFNVALSFTVAALAQVLPICLWIRPRVSGGAAASINVIGVHCNHSPN